MQYYVLTADVNRSRTLAQRPEMQQAFFAIIEDANRNFANQLHVPFAVTLGDEWQGVPKSLAASYELAVFFMNRLHPVRISFGIGEGSIATAIRQRSSEMDGQAFHYSRQALETCKKTRRDVLFITLDPGRDLIVNAFCYLLQALRERWTQRQFEKILLYKELQQETRVAAKLDVTQGDINQALKASHGKVYLQCEEQLIQYLNNSHKTIK